MDKQEKMEVEPTENATQQPPVRRRLFTERGTELSPPLPTITYRDLGTIFHAPRHENWCERMHEVQNRMETRAAERRL